MIEPWADAPLKDPGRDRLDRGPFVEMVAQLVEHVADSNDSTVLGLVGAWGSGKSTVLNYVTRRLRSTIKVVKFNPWSFDDDSTLQAELYSSILDAFPIGSHENIRKKAIDVLRRGAPALKAIPFVGAAASETVKEFLPSKSWDSAFNDLGKAIQEASVKILVLVDDVDRLQPKELLLLMKTVRLLGRFPRVNYLLAFDRNSTINTLCVALGTESPATAEDYLEKIVQYPLDMPASQQKFLQEIVFGELGPILDKRSGLNFGPTMKFRFEAFYRDHMWTSLDTPRACYRYALQAKTFLPLTGGDVDPADFFALTFLRLFYPNLYNKLRTWKDRLAVTAYLREHTRPDSRNEWLQRIVECGFSTSVADELLDAISSIFPQAVQGQVSSALRGGDYRAADPEYFDRYFTFSLPVNDVSDVVVRRDLDSVIDGTIPPGALCVDSFDHPVHDMQMLAVRKGMRHTVYEANTSRLVQFLSFALSRDPVDYQAAVDAAQLKIDWLQKLLERQGKWPAADMRDLVERFHRPAALGIALVRALSAAFDVQPPSPLDGLSSEDNDAAIPRPPSFASELANLWVERAASWLIEEWKVEASEVPDAEVLDVWNLIVSLDGLKHLQSVTADALMSGPLTLTRLASRFVFPQRLLGNHRASPNDIVLAMNKLADTVPPGLLESLPLEAVEEPLGQGDFANTAFFRRAAVGVEGLAQWRANRGKEAC